MDHLAPQECRFCGPPLTYRLTTSQRQLTRMRIVAYSPYNRANWAMQWQETGSASLRSQIRAIVQAIEMAASDLVVKLEEAAREAEIRHQQWLEQEKRRRREEDRRRIEQSIADSNTELRQAIERWSEVMSIERFLAGVEQRANDLSTSERGHVLERLALARAFRRARLLSRLEDARRALHSAVYQRGVDGLKVLDHRLPDRSSSRVTPIRAEHQAKSPQRP